jgi:hypothetical protein
MSKAEEAARKFVNTMGEHVNWERKQDMLADFLAGAEWQRERDAPMRAALEQLSEPLGCRHDYTAKEVDQRVVEIAKEALKESDE